MTQATYIADNNPFSLPAPPDWFQRGLSAFDADLVLLPSRQRPVYQLARRRKYSAGLSEHAIVDPLNDTAMYVRYGLVPVTWVFSREGWTQGFLDHIIAQLRARDTWTLGDGPLTPDQIRAKCFDGTSKYADAVDAKDDAAEAKIDADNRDMCHQATGEAWRYRQHLVGDRVLNAGMPSASVPAAQGEPSLARDAEPSSGV